MSTAPFPTDRLPRPFDAEAAERLLLRFGERDATAKQFAASSAGAALLGALGGHSPYLAELALREAPSLMRMAERGPDEALELALAPLSRLEAGIAREPLGAVLRQAKRQVALIAAAADLAGLWPLDRVTGVLSDLADTTIDLACAHLLLTAEKRGELKLARGAGSGRLDPRQVGRGSGLIVLGMGKLGGRELNYSSDVDLMLLYDPEAAAYNSENAGACYVRIGRDLVKLMEERTAEGYVFRTDLRLRPDPAATPLAVSMHAALVYYESMGQNWERAAMIKARPVAGDRALGDGFLKEMRPFVWRRHLDFAAVADIHSIKRQIHAHKGAKGAHATVRLEGHDVKLGRGGIREIEFTAQVLQLIWGGRDPGLRDPTTLGALAALAAAGKLDRRAAADLADAYVFLRNLEHRIQMVADRQTHRLPEDQAGLARIASFMGHGGLESFTAAFMGHLQRVERHYEVMFESAPTLSDEDGGGGNLVFTGVEDDPGTIDTLRRMGFAEPSSVAAMVRGWHHGRPRATRSPRARELLTELMPALLAAFARQSQPDQALARFDGVLARLPAGVQVLSLLHRNPMLLDRMAGILGAAPQLADHLARNAAALDGLLAGSFAARGGEAAAYSAPLPALVKEAAHIEEALESARRLATERKFEIDAATFEGALDVDTAGGLRSDLADAAINALLPRVSADFAERFGTVAGGQLAVMALGKLGGREMLPGSDLDLILLYDHDPEAAESSGGRRSLAPSEYFIRLAHQVVAAITAPGAEGRLFEVDMRLRPSGNKGPVAVRFATFEQYHRESAWTWERMALTRARVVAGPPAFRRRIAATLREILTRDGNAAKALADAAAMRVRMLRELPAEGPWDVKAMPGGLIEVEFVAQALQLAHAAARPEILCPTTRIALERLGKAGILPMEEAQVLIAADRLWLTISGLMRLTVGHWRKEELPGPATEALLRAVRPLLDPPPVDLPALRAQMRERAAMVRAIFERRIGPLGEKAE